MHATVADFDRVPVKDLVEHMIFRKRFVEDLKIMCSLSFQMCLASSVRLAYFLLRNVRLCCVYRCLNVSSVSPM